MPNIHEKKWLKYRARAATDVRGLHLVLHLVWTSARLRLLCFSASPRTLGLGHALGLTPGLRLGLALV